MKQRQMVKRSTRNTQPALDVRSPSGRSLPFWVRRLANGEVEPMSSAGASSAAWTWSG